MLSHQTSGKTQFIGYSFDVKIEGKNVCRHIDFTTSNHGSYPAGTPPYPNAETMTAKKALDAGKCACCDGDKHGKGADMHEEEWYQDNNVNRPGFIGHQFS